MDPSNRKIHEITGTHIGSRKNEDVKAVWIKTSNLLYFPSGLEEFFANVEGISIQRSKLLEIRAEDLKPFPKLKYLALNHNDLQVVEKDLFQFNSKLEFIHLANNKIAHVDQNVFNNFVDKLSYLYLSGNLCGFDDAKLDKPKANEIIQKVQTGSCKDEEKAREFANQITTLTRLVNSAELDKKFIELRKIIREELTSEFEKKLEEQKEEFNTKVQTLIVQISECKTNLNNITSQDLEPRVRYIESEVGIRPQDYKRARRP